MRPERVPRICVVGGSNTDLIAYIPRRLGLAECMTGSSFHISFGGKGANQAVMAARLGAHVIIVTRLGDDRFGRDYLDNFRAQGVDTAFVTVDQEQASGTSLILVEEPTGLNTIGWVPGASWGLSPDHVRAAREAIETADVLACELEVPRDATLEACRIARAAAPHGPLVVLNAAPVPVDVIPPTLLALVDVLVVNEEEAAALASSPVETLDEAKATVAALGRLGPAAVVITLGARGVVFAARGEPVRHVPAPAVRAVDTTGAGDAFVGTLAWQLAMGRALGVAIEGAVGVASLTVGRTGAQPSYPAASEVRDFLATG